jgi:HIV Tat-specific factor 1
LDEALLEQQREAYKVHGVDEDEPAAVKQQQKKKRKERATGDEVSPVYCLPSDALNYKT